MGAGGAGKAGINQGWRSTPRKSDLPDSGAGSNYRQAAGLRLEPESAGARACMYVSVPGCACLHVHV